MAKWRGHIIAVLVLTVGGTLLFGLLHALLIEPIWSRLLGGLPLALLAAAAMTWCYSQLVSRQVITPTPVGGILFGAGLWLALLPMTGVAAVLRTSGLRQTLGAFEPAVELLAAAVTGAAAGWLIRRSGSLALACGACVTAAVVAMAGPIAVTVGPTQRQLLLGFLPLYGLAGGGLAFLLRGRPPLQNASQPSQRAA